MTKATTKKTAAKKTAAPDTAGDQLGTKITEGDVDEMSNAEEVAARSQDITEAETSEVHVKEYVLLKSQWTESVDQEATHLANLEAARQAMIHQGLRPTDDGSFDAAEDHPDGLSVILRYTIPAVPASDALDEGGFHVSHAHVTLEDQHAAEATGEPEKTA